MKFINRHSTAAITDDIIKDLIANDSSSYDLGILFISNTKKDDIKNIVNSVKKALNIKHILCCTAAGIITTDAEIERNGAASLLLAQLPDVKVQPFSLSQHKMEGFKTKEDWYNHFDIYPMENPIFVVLPDPFNFDMHEFLDGLNLAYFGCPVIGGLASAAMEPNMNTIVVDDKMADEGIVGVVLSGNILVDMIVSQGCRPIGETFIVTRAQGNIIYELAGKTFLEVLEKVVEELPAKDRILAQDAIFIGLAMDEYKHTYHRGDFLIRGVLGVDDKVGAGLVGDNIKTGQTIQFHLRDAQTATDDLNQMLKQSTENPHWEKPQGMLVFSCNGRGEHLFHEKNHDIKIIQHCIGPVPAAGFFCAGEIGPLGRYNFLHGFTDSIALFYPKTINRKSE